MAGPYTAEDEQKLMLAMWSPDIADNPYKWVMFAFPWGVKGTPLEKFPNGPRKWQADELKAMAAHIEMNKKLIAEGKMPIVYQSATSSGRGVGKSALVGMIVMWQMSCVLGSTIIAAANSETQLRTKTWAEVGKWHTMAINKHWFEKTALKLEPAPWFKERVEKDLKVDCGYYYAQGLTWTEENPDSFAGAHNFNGMTVIFDEASGIPRPIWTVTSGFFTDPSAFRFHFAFSNPRRNTGEFYECFHKARDQWSRRNLDSRSVEGADVNYLNGIIAKHGDDSDEARIEVKGQFPRQGDKQFISRESVEAAAARDILPDHHAGLILGIDVARFGDDSTVFYFRRGRDARSIKPIKFKGLDNMAVANEAAFYIDKEKPDAICVDAGNGTGVIDRLKEMGYKVHEVWFGSKADEEEWADKRTEMWAKIREWLPGGCIVDDADLKDDLVGPEYGFDKLERIKLEAKEMMKRRGVASPDVADALACTFAIKVARSDMRVSKPKGQRMAKDVDYNPFS